MQTWLKRHPNYATDYDSNSIVIKGSDLEDKITLFEEKSRNYKGIDFSKAIADPVKIAKVEIEMKKAEKLLEDAPPAVPRKIQKGSRLALPSDQYVFGL